MVKIHSKTLTVATGRTKVSFRWLGLGIAWGLVISLGIFFRLARLGESAFRADTIMFWNICHQPMSGMAVFSRWIELGGASQMPFSLAFTKGIINLFHLPVTDFFIRLPNACFGILAILFAYRVGRELSGQRFGLFLALIFACNPFHIQLSREAYFYSALVLGATMQLWSVLWLYRRRHTKGALSWHFHVFAGAGFFLLLYSHFSGWWLAALVVPSMAWLLIGRLRTGRGPGRDLGIWLLTYGIIGIPLLFVAWGIPFFLHDLTSPEAKAEGVRRMGPQTISIPTILYRLSTSMSFGTTAIGIGLIIVVCLFSAVYFMKRPVWKGRHGMVLLLLLGSLGIYLLAYKIQQAYFAVRHVSILLPLFLTLLMSGLWHISSFGGRLKLRPVMRRLTVYGVAGVALLVLLPPAYWSTRLTGKPIPYKEIAHWCDTHLPPRTLVLVERWFDPWNELRVHNSTNVYFTFTVPAEPEDVFERLHWPATAKQFFNHFPDAAYLEYCNGERKRMDVVPNVFFARQITFTNQAGIKLARYGVAYRDEFYDPYTNRLISTIFYNTREDVIRHAREQGQTTLVLYEPSWGYTKLWQQTQDFRDWRIMEDQATLDVYNLTSAPLTADIRIMAVALGGTKRVRAGSQAFDFQSNRIMEWPLTSWPLQPGLNRIELTDNLGAWAKPLLVGDIRVTDTGEDQGTATGPARDSGSKNLSENM